MKNQTNSTKNPPFLLFSFWKLSVVEALLFSLLPFCVFAQSGEAGPLTWSLKDGTLTISGSGAMPDYPGALMPWKPYKDSIYKVVIESGVTSIGIRAFYEHPNLNSVSIPGTVSTIRDCAFQLCSALTSIVIPDGVESIGVGAFNSCKSLSSAFIPNSVTSIGRQAFIRCTSLSSLTISNNITRIEVQTFQNCESLPSFTIPNKVTSIGQVAFDGCEHLTSINIPKSVTIIEDDAFWGCYRLKLITNYNPVPVKIYRGVLSGVDRASCIIEVPASAVTAYQNANVWEEFQIVSINGIESLENDAVMVYPNPTTGELRFTNYDLRIENVEIYDIYGKKESFDYAQLPKGEGEMVIDLSSLQAGIYFVKIQTETGTVTKKVVKE